MHGDHHGLWIDPKNPVDPVQRERRRLLAVRGRREDLEVGTRGAGRALLQRCARQQHAGLGLRVDPGSRQLSRQDRSERRPRHRSSRVRGRTPQAAKVRTRRSTGRTRTSSTRTASTATSRARTRAFRARSAAVEARPRKVRPAEARRRRPPVHSARPISGQRTQICARSGWRRSSSRRTTRARSTPATSSSSARRTRERPGRRLAAISRRTIRSRCCRRARTRFRTRRSSRWPSPRGRPACSTPAPTTGACM